MLHVGQGNNTITTGSGYISTIVANSGGANDISVGAGGVDQIRLGSGTHTITAIEGATYDESYIG